MESLVFVLLVFTFLLRIWIGIELFVSSRQNNLPNLRWLGGYFLLNAFNVLFAPIVDNPLGNFSFSLMLFIVPVLISQGLLILFNQDTFYADKKSPAPWYWLLFIVTTLGSLYGIFISKSNFNQSAWVASYIVSQIAIWSWHASLAYRAWSGIANKPSVQDWVKSRYILTVIYPIIYIIGSLGSAARILFAEGANNTPLGASMALLTLLAQSVSVILQFLVWVMPSAFRTWLNRNYQSRIETYSHEHSSAILHLIGSAMAQESGIAELGVLRALRQSIGATIGSTDMSTIDAAINQMGYKDWDAALKNAELIHLLLQYGTTQDVNTALESARRTLVKEQSLFTLEAK